MSETFDATTGDLYAVYATDIDEGVNYVDALYWISEDGDEAYYIVGNDVFDTDTDKYDLHELFVIPQLAKAEVTRTMLLLEGASPRGFDRQLDLADITEIIQETMK